MRSLVLEWLFHNERENVAWSGWDDSSKKIEIGHHLVFHTNLYIELI